MLYLKVYNKVYYFLNTSSRWSSPLRKHSYNLSLCGSNSSPFLCRTLYLLMTLRCIQCTNSGIMCLCF